MREDRRWSLRKRADALRIQHPLCCHPLVHISLHLVLLTLLLLDHLPSPLPSAPSHADLSTQLNLLRALHSQALTDLSSLRAYTHTLHFFLAQQYTSTDDPHLLAFLADNASYSVPPPPLLMALHETDLSHPDRAGDPLHAAAPVWDYCAATAPLPWCEESAISEQYYQLTFFDRPGAGKRVTPREGRPKHTDCIQLPPVGYRWPNKSAPLPCPATSPASCIHLPNLRVSHVENLTVFNPATPKNLYHFLPAYVDREQELLLRLAAQYIPFGAKVRLVLDIGAGGGSLGLLLHRKYGVQTLSTAFADWPYCEYIGERGGLCAYLDAMEPMPFAKFTFDVVHTAWVLHATTVEQLRVSMLEQHRVLRPGGWLWLMGGWSKEQVGAMEALLVGVLGYVVVWQSKEPHDASDGWTFDSTPFELEWHAVLQRPIKAVCGTRDRRDT